MNLSRIETIFSEFERDPLPQLCAATDRLRRLAATAPDRFTEADRDVLDEALHVAVKAEQTLAVQRARIRYLEGPRIPKRAGACPGPSPAGA